MFRKALFQRCSSAAGGPPPFLFPIHQLPSMTEGSKVTLRGRLEKSRVKGKLGFLQLRQPPLSTVQCVVSVAKEAPTEEAKELLATAKALSPESVIELTGTVVIPEKPIQSTTCQTVEIATENIKTISRAATPLPFPLKDETTKLDTKLDHRPFNLRTLSNAAIFRLQSQATQYFRRYHLQKGFLEIHTPKIIATPSEGGSAIFQLGYFGRDAYLAQSPQLYKQMAVQGDLTKVIEIGPIFRAENSQGHRHLTEYTGLDAEMAIHGGGDGEAPGHYEVLNQLEGVVVYMIQCLQSECADLTHAAWPAPAEDKAAAQEGEGATSAEETALSKSNTLVNRPHHVVAQIPTEVIENLGISDDSNPTNLDLFGTGDTYGGRVGDMDCPVLRLAFDNAVKLLKEEGLATIDAYVEAGAIDGGAEKESALELLSALKVGETDDFNSAQEKLLGKVVKRRYGVDLYIIDEYHLSARPFYTMPTSATVTGGEKRKSRSFDMFLRGEEICSGAQRIHDVDQLISRAKECNVSTDLLKDYLEAFKYGSWPHGGYGIGLERFIMFYLGLPNIRMTSMFPRDPKRVTP